MEKTDARTLMPSAQYELLVPNTLANLAEREWIVPFVKFPLNKPNIHEAMLCSAYEGKKEWKNYLDLSWPNRNLAST